jgi:hypothetical protein
MPLGELADIADAVQAHQKAVRKAMDAERESGRKE